MAAVEDVYGMGMPGDISGSVSALISRLHIWAGTNDMVYGQILGYTSERVAN